MADEAEPTTTPPGFVPAIILQNRGVPITLYRLEHGEVPTVEDGEERPTRKVHLRFTANHVAQIEDAFDGIVARVPIVETKRVFTPDGKPLEGPDGPVTDDTVVGYEERVFYGVQAFEQSLSQKTMKTVRAIFAIAFGLGETEAGNAMIPDKAMEYQTAVGVAWAIAQGVDPTEAAKILRQGLAAVEEGRASLASELRKTMGPDEASTIEAPGGTGSLPGAPPVEG